MVLEYMLLYGTVYQRFSIYGWWTTCDPRSLPLWSLKKRQKEKNRIEMKCVSDYRWKPPGLEMTQGNRFLLYNGALQIIILFASTYSLSSCKYFFPN